MTFGEKLQLLRQKAGFSQEALAEKLEISRQAVSRWERNETLPETEKVIALADFFQVTTDFLLRDAEQAPPAKETPKRATLRYLVETKAYLLGWVLIAWGIADLAPLLVYLWMFLY